MNSSNGASKLIGTAIKIGDQPYVEQHTQWSLCLRISSVRDNGRLS
ncbi:MAG: hypothetical protein ACTS78_01605 [Arsenophonus sp. NC-WZS1-MAG3]